MRKWRNQFERFCFRYRNYGIPNLMLYISLGTLMVYLMVNITGNPILYNLLVFNRAAILKGQVWRLISYPLTFFVNNPLLMALALFCYYSIGRAMETVWGTLRFNLFYLCGILLMDVYCMIFGCTASVTYLNMSLFLSYATLFPNAQFLLFFIIPVKAWIFALLDLALTFYSLLTSPFPYNLFSIISLANYFLFFGKDVLNVIPVSWRVRLMKVFRRQSSKPKVIPFSNSGSGKSSPAASGEPYHHKCAVCGRTDVTNPELEFRYCSRCKGYYCYCEDHISNHTHIE